jgi:hypothetical protein
LRFEICITLIKTVYDIFLANMKLLTHGATITNVGINIDGHKIKGCQIDLKRQTFQHRLLQSENLYDR